MAGQQYQMITENPPHGHPPLRPPSRHPQKLLKITKETHQHLILTDGTAEMLFRRYDLHHVSSVEFLRKRSHLRHEALLQIYKVECEHDLEKEAERESTNCGILFEKYSKTLGESVKEMINFTPEEVIETLQPVREVIDYLITQDYDPGEINLSSIVCTEDYDIKFLDSFFQKEALKLAHRPQFKTLLYQELASLLFELLFPQDKHVKSWKCRYELAEKKLDEKYLQFYRDVYMKFAPTFIKEDKSKKIRKGDVRKEEIRGERVGQRRRTSKIQKDFGENGLKWQHGKENKIIQ